MDNIARKALEKADSWWPPIHEALEAFEKEWRHSWRFDVGDRSVLVGMMGFSPDIPFTRDGDFVERLGNLATSSTKLEEAIEKAARAYARRIPVMTKWQGLRWRVRGRFKKWRGYPG